MNTCDVIKIIVISGEVELLKFTQKNAGWVLIFLNEFVSPWSDSLDTMSFPTSDNSTRNPKLSDFGLRGGGFCG
jgi:hypothetical protein